MATPTEEDNRTAKQEEDILVEKDGRFELVKVKDMQASPKIESAEPKTKEGGTDTTLQDGETPHSNDTEKKSNTKQTETETNIKSESTVKFSDESTKPPPPTSGDTLTSTNSVSQLTRTSKPRQPASSRTKSAPGLREREQEEVRQKKERSEAAFRAWLSKKDRQLSEQRRNELSKVKQTDEDQQEKQRRNEVAYKAWLECKKQEYLEQRVKDKASRPVTSVSRDDKQRKRATFENWLSVKQKAIQKENETKQKLKEQEELSAKKADPSIVSQAYKSWLHRKETQAREEALIREQYRKKYFRQSRQLKQSTNLRFEGF